MMNNHIPLHISPTLFERVCPPPSQHSADPASFSVLPSQKPVCCVCNSVFTDFTELSRHREVRGHHVKTFNSVEVNNGQAHSNIRRHSEDGNLYKKDKIRSELNNKDMKELNKTVKPPYIPKGDIQRETDIKITYPKEKDKVLVKDITQVANKVATTSTGIAVGVEGQTASSTKAKAQVSPAKDGGQSQVSGNQNTLNKEDLKSTANASIHSVKKDDARFQKSKVEDNLKDKCLMGTTKFVRPNSSSVLKVSKGVNTNSAELKLNHSLSQGFKKHKSDKSSPGVVKDDKYRFMYSNCQNMLFMPDIPTIANKKRSDHSGGLDSKIKPQGNNTKIISESSSPKPEADLSRKEIKPFKSKEIASHKEVLKEKEEATKNKVDIKEKIYVSSTHSKDVLKDKVESMESLPKKSKLDLKEKIDVSNIYSMHSKEASKDKMDIMSKKSKVEGKEKTNVNSGYSTNSKEVSKDKMKPTEPLPKIIKVDVKDKIGVSKVYSTHSTEVLKEKEEIPPKSKCEVKEKSGESNVYTTREIIERCLRCKSFLSSEKLTVNVVRMSVIVPCSRCHAVNEMLGVFKPKP